MQTVPTYDYTTIHIVALSAVGIYGAGFGGIDKCCVDNIVGSWIFRLPFYTLTVCTLHNDRQRIDRLTALFYSV
jgi:hypothetical protein